MLLTNSEGAPIHCVEEWKRLAPPKNPALHWQPGRSALELARSWCVGAMPAVPAEVERVLCSGWPQFSVSVAVAEVSIRLDGFRGGTRNADLLVEGKVGPRSALLTVEAKADESFGDRIEAVLDVGRNKNGSNIPARIERLSQMVFDRPPSGPILQLRYQLLHGLAATALEATRRQVPLAAFIVQEFKTDRTTASALKRNAADWRAFLAQFSPDGSTHADGKLLGPFHLPGSAVKGVEMFIGKASHCLA